jgi:hypothetical protein
MSAQKPPKKNKPFSWAFFVATVAAIASVGQFALAGIEHFTGNSSYNLWNIVINNVPGVRNIIPTPAPTPVPAGVSSNGITAALKLIIFKTDMIEPHIVVTNTTDRRVYVRNVDRDEQGTFDSEASVSEPTPTGIQGCYNHLAACLSNANEINIETFTPIDPGGQLNLQLRYSVANESNVKDTFSFPLVLVARYVQSDVLTDVGRPTQLNYSFPNNAVERE